MFKELKFKVIFQIGTCKLKIVVVVVGDDFTFSKKLRYLSS